MQTKELDIVYVLKEGSDAEFRYSLRSLVNFPHRRVWVYGWCPTWANGVFHIPMEPKGLKWQNTSNMLKSAASNPQVTEDFVYFNDDFFIMEPIKELGYYYSGTLSDRIKTCKITTGAIKTLSRYGRQLQACDYYLEKKGISTRNYELHIPMIFNKQKLLRAWRMLPADGFGARRSLYGNTNEVGGEEREDCKVYDLTEKYTTSDPFLSTTNMTFAHGEVGKQIRRNFRKRCIYEREIF